MSHFSVCKVKIQNPNLDLLKDVVREMGREMQGQIVSEIRDYSGKSKDFDIGFTTRTMPMGVGVRVRNGQVELIGDFYGVNKASIEAELTKMYTATAVAKVLQRMGYQVQAQKDREKVIINARN